MTPRDGHVRVLPLHVANKIAAGEVVERPASVVKELVENAIDAGAKNVRISVTQGGRKLVSVQDDGCGMTRDDAVLSLERQATSKILDVGDIEEIDTLGFRGEAIPSIASVSRFTITTRRRDADEGTLVQVNAGTLAEVRAAGCPPGTLVEVRDLFCNVPARRKFLRSYATEESHIRHVFTVHALAHPSIGFSLSSDGREIYRLAPAGSIADRVIELFGRDFAEDMLAVGQGEDDTRRGAVRVSGYVERPNLNTPTRREQYVFVNGRPATAGAISYALREAYPRRQGDVRPAAILFIDLPPNQVDVNVHPTKREVRFRDNSAVRQAIMSALEKALNEGRAPVGPITAPVAPEASRQIPAAAPATPPIPPPEIAGTGGGPVPAAAPLPQPTPVRPPMQPAMPTPARATALPAPTPVQVEFAVEPDSTASRPWRWFKFLALTESGYLLVETDAGVVTVNPQAARERITFERLTDGADPQSRGHAVTQPLLMPEVVQLSPPDAARIRASLPSIAAMGFAVEEFGRDTFKIDAVPQIIGSSSPAAILSTVASDLAAPGARRGDKWREELIAKSIAKSFAGMSGALNEEGATKLIDELASCRMPYVCPRGKPIMIFTSTRELNRKFGKD